MIFRNKTMLFRCKTLFFLETELAKVYYGLAKVQYQNKKRHSFEELCLFLIVDDRLLMLTGRRISVAGQTHQIELPVNSLSK